MPGGQIAAMQTKLAAAARLEIIVYPTPASLLRRLPPVLRQGGRGGVVETGAGLAPLARSVTPCPPISSPTPPCSTPQRSRPTGRAPPPSIYAHGGRYLVRGGAHGARRRAQPQTIIVIEFPDRATAERWYASPEYASALEERDTALTRSLVLVDGVAAGCACHTPW